MTIIKFPQNRKASEPPFFSDIREDGYHFFSRDNAKIKDYYQPAFPEYPFVSINDLEEGDIITVRVFFGIGKGKKMRVDSGLLDLEVEFVDVDKVMAVITTQLPDGLALSTGESIDIFEDEILYKAKSHYS